MNNSDYRVVVLAPFFCLLFLIQAPCAAQYRTTTPSSARYRLKAEKMITNNNSLERQGEEMCFKRISEGQYFLYNTDGSFLYLGEIRNESSIYPHGAGLGMTKCRDEETGAVANEYVLCRWRRGSRHGEGIIKHPDGCFEKALWKWNKKKTIPDSDVSPEEQEEMEEQIKNLEIAYKWFYTPPVTTH